MVELSFLPGAQEDYDESYDWYLERSEEAAERFEAAVEGALREIVDAPDRWALCDAKHRAKRLIRFPYRVVYRRDGDIIVVVAIAHAKRRPGYWAQRD